MQWADIDASAAGANQAGANKAGANQASEDPRREDHAPPADMRKASARRIDHLKLMADMQNYFNITRSTAEYLRWRSKYDDFSLELQNAIVRANAAVHWATLRKEFSLEGEEMLLKKYYEKSTRVHRNTEDAGGWRIVTHKRRRNQRRALNRYLEHEPEAEAEPEPEPEAEDPEY
jgi:hypothetical protein